jgi:transposase
MISLAPGTKVFLACQPIDLRAGFNGLAAKAQQVIGQNPFDGSLFIFRGKSDCLGCQASFRFFMIWQRPRRLKAGAARHRLRRLRP